MKSIKISSHQIRNIERSCPDFIWTKREKRVIIASPRVLISFNYFPIQL